MIETAHKFERLAHKEPLGEAAKGPGPTDNAGKKLCTCVSPRMQALVQQLELQLAMLANLGFAPPSVSQHERIASLFQKAWRRAARAGLRTLRREK